MKATIESTASLVDITGNKHMARVWEGITENGIPFVAYIAMVQVRSREDNTEFERGLREHKQPAPETIKAIDARFF